MSDDLGPEYVYIRDELGIDALNYLAFDVEGMDVDGDDSDEAVNGFMLEYLWNSKRDDKRTIGPAEVYSDCPHAYYIEFGTGPAKNGTLKDKGESLHDVIHEWAERKLGDRFKTDAQLESFVKRVVKQIYRDGIPPQPYLRAAVYQTLDEDLDGREFREGEISLYDVAEMIARHVMENLSENDTDYTGALRASIQVDYLDGATLSGGEVKIPDTGATEVGEGNGLLDTLWARDNKLFGVPDRNGALKKPRRRF